MRSGQRREKFPLDDRSHRSVHPETIVVRDPRRLDAITTDRFTTPRVNTASGGPGRTTPYHQRVNQRLFSIDCLALTRLDKSPRGGAKQKRIQTVLHEDDVSPKVWQARYR
jgi:hypothetical protein